ncbi:MULTISPECIES: fatty acyl-CoA synthetase [Acinetobacter calcoaceticus/baumannii complex]|uniref:fatty acyl-CoA synthetase n=1 Tax=Acinetobacter calcoaceticus/baumannii complex TaxID=909768 RepID=UPI00244753D0|nr:MULTISPECIES: fatty acyl-CoA synthetase [Acinetobacter calcoaceticus/baumannii complex]MDH2595960.1 fatty acyl-CoA synthetase [Acinetobacter baumannii]MDO7537220.1 fatty acyl-CoA synthetase [Acinetobacter pittii]
MMNEISRARQMHISDIPNRSAQRYGDKIALIDGDKQLSYNQLKHSVDIVAKHLFQQGLRKGDKLMLLSHNCWQFPTVMYAAAKLGVLSVPINFMLNHKEIGYLLEHAKPKMVLVEDILCPIMEKALENISDLEPKQVVLHLNQECQIQDIWEDFERYLVDFDFSLPSQELRTNDPIRMMYTSGTESLPKGVLLSSESLLWQYSSCMVEGEMTSEDKEIHSFPLYHCAQLDAFLNVDLMLGATNYIFRRFDPETVLKTIEKEKITKLFCPPTAWIAMLNHPIFATTNLSSLKKAYYGASTMPKAIIEQLIQKLPHIRFWQFYGQTEMAPLATVLHPHEHQNFAESVGKPALYVETQIMDEQGNILNADELGEIVHRSAHLTLGYDQNDEKTLESFKYGWFHSGDLGYFNQQGYLFVVDRIKDMVKTGGENVSTREVEDILYQHESVQEVAVFGLPHEHWIEAVTAAVVLHQNTECSANELIKFCMAHLSTYKVPKNIYIVTELPKNASGKVLKRELKKHYS